MKGGGGQPEKPDQTPDDPKVFNMSAKHWKWFIQDGEDYSLICSTSKPFCAQKTIQEWSA